MMKFLLFLLILWSSAFNSCVADAADRVPQRCLRAAEKMKLVTVNYNYGELKFDASKTAAQISQVCSDQAAGCFYSTSGSFRNIAVTPIEVDGGCRTFQIKVDFDFTGSVLYITNEYGPCETRAVLRHELQHFMNWKASKEQVIRETKIALKRWSIKNMKECKKENECSSADYRYGATSEAAQIVSNILEKWNAIGEKNNIQLDAVDHNVDKEMNYSVCAAYSLKIVR